jgi:hypothetical protein
LSRRGHGERSGESDRGKDGGQNGKLTVQHERSPTGLPETVPLTAGRARFRRSAYG